MAIERACHLLEKYANGKVLSDTIVYDNIEKKEKDDSKLTKENYSFDKVKISLDNSFLDDEDL